MGVKGLTAFFCPLDCSLFIIRKTRDARKLDTKDLWDARVEGQARELNYNTWYDPYSTIDHAIKFNSRSYCIVQLLIFWRLQAHEGGIE